MFINLDQAGSVAGLRRLLSGAIDNDQVTGMIVLACEENGFTPGSVDTILKQSPKPVFGGIFHSIIFNRKKLDRGTIVAGIRRPVKAVAVDRISEITNLDIFLEHTFETRLLQNKTMFVIVDGLSRHISPLIDSMLNCFGIIPNYIGGGAGSLSGRKPCVISGEGLLEDAAVFALVDMESGIGVAHGWEPVAGPLKVTGAEGHKLISLNWRPAFTVYREVVEKISGNSFDHGDFFQLAKGFPFGIVKLAREMVVRDPIVVDGTSLICVGEVPLNSLVYILKGNTDSLIAGALKARQLAEKSYWQPVKGKKEGPPITFFIDCVSRVLFLQSDFERELEAVYTGGALLGALTLGEIANTGKSYLEYYNKTSVVGLLKG